MPARYINKLFTMQPFTEKQRLADKWIVVLPVLMLVLAAVFMSDAGVELLLLYSAVPVVVFLFLTFYMHLCVSVDQHGITYSYRPFIKTHSIAWSEVELAEVKKYNALMEYGGWGIRVRWGKKRALNVWGNMGLILHLKNGKKLVLGTQQSTALTTFLKQLKAAHSITSISV